MVTAAFNCCKIAEWCGQRFAATCDCSSQEVETAECRVRGKAAALTVSVLASVGSGAVSGEGIRRSFGASLNWNRILQHDWPTACRSHLPVLLVAFVQLSVGRLLHQAALMDGNGEAECCSLFHH